MKQVVELDETLCKHLVQYSLELGLEGKKGVVCTVVAGAGAINFQVGPSEWLPSTPYGQQADQATPLR